MAVAGETTNQMAAINVTSSRIRVSVGDVIHSFPASLRELAPLHRAGDRNMQRHRIAAWQRSLVSIAASVALAGTLQAQWLEVRLPGVPRTPDGKTNLNAATPRTPDGKPNLAGIWRADSMKYNTN